MDKGVCEIFSTENTSWETEWAITFLYFFLLRDFQTRHYLSQVDYKIFTRWRKKYIHIVNWFLYSFQRWRHSSSNAALNKQGLNYMCCSREFLMFWALWACFIQSSCHSSLCYCLFLHLNRRLKLNTAGTVSNQAKKQLELLQACHFKPLVGIFTSISLF